MKKKLNLLTIATLTACVGLTGCNEYTQSELDSAVAQSYDEGYADGDADGYDRGYGDGEADGYDRGYNDGDADGFDRGFQQGASADVLTAYNTGYSTGFSAGDAAGYSRGYNTGDAAGYTRGHGVGYAAGDAAGYTRGHNVGYSAGQTVGYNNGVAVGYDNGYDDGYDDGFDDGSVSSNGSYDLGYNDGFADGSDIGYDTGYGDGLADGYDIGYGDGLDDGYDIGFDDGYDIGYDDGWYDAGGFSEGSSKASASHKIASAMLTDLIDFKKLKSPKQVLKDVETQRLMLGTTSGVTMDAKTQNALLEDYVIGAMKKQLVTSYGLSEARSKDIAKLANRMIKVAGERELNSKDTNAFSKSVIGSDLVEMKTAYDKSLKGETAELANVINTAAKINGITPEHSGKIMSKLFL